MVLLHVLHHLSNKHGWKLFVAHFNHQLRGRSSDADERFVRMAAKRFQIPFVSGRANVKAFAQRQKLSIEMAARQLRHDFLARMARKRKISTIALAHHADDQVELFFLRSLRGAGSEGLAGMKPKSPSPIDPQITLIRPLLHCSRKQIEEFALEQKVPFRQDKTNAGLDFLRNRCRHELLPLLAKSYQPSLSRILSRTMTLLEAESEFVAEAALAWLEKKAPGFNQLHVAVQRRVLQLQLFRLNVQADFDSIEHLRLRPEVPLTLGPGLSLRRAPEGEVRIEKQTATPGFNLARVDLELTKSGTVSFGGLVIHWQIDLISGVPPEVKALTSTNTGHECFDADKVGATIALRHWQPGDRFQPIGLPERVKLQDLFTNQKVPQTERHRRIIAIAASGEPFWAQGLRISERFKLDKKTVRHLNWHWKAY